MSGIRLSKEFGVNPSVQKCNCCGKDMGLVLFGTSWKDENGKTAEAPREVMTGEICDSCKSVIAGGGKFFIEVRDGESGNNPYRTGRLVAIKAEAANNIFNKEVAPINYMENSLFEQLFGAALAAESTGNQQNG